MRSSEITLHTRLTLITATCLIAAILAAGFVLMISLNQLEADAQQYADLLSTSRAEESRLAAKGESLQARAGLLAKALAIQAESRIAEVEALAQRIGGDQLLGAYILKRSGSPVASPWGPLGGAPAKAMDRAVAARSRLEGGADLILITNRFGQLVALNGNEQDKGSEPPAYLVEAISTGLEGRSTSSLMDVPGEALHWMRAEPLRAPDGRVAGVVVAALDLSRAHTFLGSWRALLGPGTSAGLILPDGRTVDLVKAQPLGEGMGAPAGEEAPLLSEVLTHRASFAGGELSAIVDVRLPQPPPMGSPKFPKKEIWVRGGISLAIIALAGVLILSLLLRRDIAPLSTLASRARLISMGHLGISITVPKGSQEVEDLAHATERLRISLATLMDRHPIRHRWS